MTCTNIDQTGLKLVAALLTLPPKCWVCMHAFSTLGWFAGRGGSVLEKPPHLVCLQIHFVLKDDLDLLLVPLSLPRAEIIGLEKSLFPTESN